MSGKSNSKKGNWQIKRVNSKSGPLKGTMMSQAIRKPISVSGETKVLWSAREGLGRPNFLVKKQEEIFKSS